MADTPEGLAYQEGLRALSYQQDVLSTIGTRIGSIFGAAGLAATFLGGFVIREHGLNSFSLGVLACFAANALVMIFLYWPRRLTFVTDPQRLVVEYVDEPKRVEAPVMQRDLAIHFQSDYLANQRLIGQLVYAYELSIGLFGAQVILGLLAITRR